MFSNPRERWTKPEMRRHIEDSEEPLAAISAFTGILGHPLIDSGPFLIGSCLWDVILTDVRILAVQRGLLRSPPEPERISIPIDDILNLDIVWDWGMQANVRIWTKKGKQELKIVGFPHDTYEFKQALAAIRVSTTGAPQRP